MEKGKTCLGLGLLEKVICVKKKTDAHGSCSGVLAAASTTEVIRKQSVKYVDVCDEGEFFTHGHDFLCIFRYTEQL